MNNPIFQVDSDNTDLKKTIKNPELYQQTKLGQYLLAKNESAYDFEKYAKIDIVTIYKILNGKPIRKDIAKRIMRVTKKRVTMEDFGYVSPKSKSVAWRYRRS